MVAIRQVRYLTKYEDYSDAQVYHYDDGSQKFYFDVDYSNEKPGVMENGNLVSPPEYDVLIPLIGKTDVRSRVTMQVESLEEIKRNIKKFFVSHNVSTAENPPGDVFFE